MQSQIIAYLTKYKEQYTQDVLIEQLQKSGYAMSDIEDAVARVYHATEADTAPIASPTTQTQNTPTTPPMGRFAMSWRVFKSSAGLLRQDKALMVFPLLSGVVSLTVLLTLFVPIAVLTGMVSALQNDTANNIMIYVWLFLYYLVGAFVVAYFNSALTACIMMRLQGTKPTIRAGLRVANKHLGQIFVWALVSATVGVLLHIILDWAHKKLSIVGRMMTTFIVGLIGVAWSLATYFVVPVIVVQNLSVKEALKSSGSLFKKTWGENVIGNISMGIFFVLLLTPIIIIGIMIAIMMQSLAGVLIGIGVSAFGILIIAIIGSALESIYKTVLYLYASTGRVAPEFDAGFLQQAFKQKEEPLVR